MYNIGLHKSKVDANQHQDRQSRQRVSQKATVSRAAGVHHALSEAKAFRRLCVSKVDHSSVSLVDGAMQRHRRAGVPASCHTAACIRSIADLKLECLLENSFPAEHHGNCYR